MLWVPSLDNTYFWAQCSGINQSIRARQCQGEIQPMLLALQTSRGALFAISSQASLLIWAWKEPLRVEGTKGDSPEQSHSPRPLRVTKLIRSLNPHLVLLVWASLVKPHKNSQGASQHLLQSLEF